MMRLARPKLREQRSSRTLLERLSPKRSMRDDNVYVNFDECPAHLARKALATCEKTRNKIMGRTASHVRLCPRRSGCTQRPEPVPAHRRWSKTHVSYRVTRARNTGAQACSVRPAPRTHRRTDARLPLGGRAPGRRQRAGLGSRRSTLGCHHRGESAEAGA